MLRSDLSQVRVTVLSAPLHLSNHKRRTQVNEEESFVVSAQSVLKTKSVGYIQVSVTEYFLLLLVTSSVVCLAISTVFDLFKPAHYYSEASAFSALCLPLSRSQVRVLSGTFIPSYTMALFSE